MDRLSVTDGRFTVENSVADGADGADARIPTGSGEPVGRGRTIDRLKLAAISGTNQDDPFLTFPIEE